MKREFKPEMTVVRFGAEDVIATSSMRISGIDGAGNIAGDGQITFRGITYSVGSQSSDLYSALSSAGYNGENTKIVKSGNTSHTIESVVSGEIAGKEFASSWNGTFVWNPSKSAFYINKQ